MYLCLISTHELLLPAAIIFSQMKRHLGGGGGTYEKRVLT